MTESRRWVDRVYPRDASWYNRPDVADSRPKAWHWPRGDGMSLCGRVAIQMDQPGLRPEDAPRLCRSNGCAKRSDPYD